MEMQVREKLPLDSDNQKSSGLGCDTTNARYPLFLEFAVLGQDS